MGIVGGIVGVNGAKTMAHVISLLRDKVAQCKTQNPDLFTCLKTMRYSYDSSASYIDYVT